jgi:hypothetical protein
VGDFDGDGHVDLGTWNDDTFYFQLWDGSGYNTPAGPIALGFPGVRERPVAADMDGDGVTDVGLWVPDRGGLSGKQGEWYFLMSNDFPQGGGGLFNRVVGTVNTLDHPFTPNTLPGGHDLFARFGDQFAIPLVGNFDPVVNAGSAATQAVKAAGSATTVATPAVTTPTATSTATSRTPLTIASMADALAAQLASTTVVTATPVAPVVATPTTTPPVSAHAAAADAVLAKMNAQLRAKLTTKTKTPIVKTSVAKTPVVKTPVVKTTVAKTAVIKAKVATTVKKVTVAVAKTPVVKPAVRAVDKVLMTNLIKTSAKTMKIPPTSAARVKFAAKPKQ